MINTKLSAPRFGVNADTGIIQKIYLSGFLLLILVLFFYQIVKGEYYFQRAKNNYVKVVPMPAIRGAIFDRNGLILAQDRATFNISVIPYQIRSKREELFKELAEFLNCSENSIHKNYKKNLLSFFSPTDIIIDVDKNTILKLKQKFTDNILINTFPQRIYPYNGLFAHILGYVKKATSFYEELKKYGYKPMERVGFMGIEQYYNSYLKGEDGGDLIEVNAKGKVVGFLGERIPHKGKDIYLTIDSRIQKLASEAISGKKGTVILMDSQNGEIIALYSYPSFDSNVFIKGKNLGKFFRDEKSPLLNRAIQSTYPLGSIFKPLVAAGALEENKINHSTTFICKGDLRLGSSKFRCWSTHHEENIYDALAHSCNVYFYNVGLMLGVNTLSKWAKTFGLNSLTGIDLPYEKTGFIPNAYWKQKKLKESWFPGDTVNFSIGQGFLQVSPLSALLAVNVFANGGYLTTPYLLKQVDDMNSNSAAKTYLGIASKNLDIVKIGLSKTVSSEDGTASILKKLNLRIAGKTGTAQTRGKSHGWFAGFFPYEKPKYSICVFLENGGSSHEALKVIYSFLSSMQENNLLENL